MFRYLVASFALFVAGLVSYNLFNYNYHSCLIGSNGPMGALYILVVYRTQCHTCTFNSCRPVNLVTQSALTRWQ